MSRVCIVLTAFCRVNIVVVTVTGVFNVVIIILIIPSKSSVSLRFVKKVVKVS